jgi:chromosomal replication initiation ATPase DnaA
VGDLVPLGRKVAAGNGIKAAALRSGIRTRGVVRARRLFYELAVRAMGYAGAEVARCFGVTASSVNRLAVSEELSEVRKYLNAL